MRKHHYTLNRHKLKQRPRTLDFSPLRGNPKHYSCHLDETMIGICKNFVRHYGGIASFDGTSQVLVGLTQEDCGAYPCKHFWASSFATLLLHGVPTVARRESATPVKITEKMRFCEGCGIPCMRLYKPVLFFCG